MFSCVILQGYAGDYLLPQIAMLHSRKGIDDALSICKVNLNEMERNLIIFYYFHNGGNLHFLVKSIKMSN